MLLSTNCFTKSFEISAQVRTIFWILAWTCFVVLIFHAVPGLADGTTCTGEDCGFNIGGEDKTSQLSAFQNIFKTAQVFLMRYAAPFTGGALVFYGIYKIALRETIVGVIALLGGGSLLFLPKVLQQIIKFAA